MNTEQILEPQETTNFIARIWQKYFPYYPIFLLIMLLTLLGAWVFNKKRPILYQANATLLIKDEKKELRIRKFQKVLIYYQVKK